MDTKILFINLFLWEVNRYRGQMYTYLLFSVVWTKSTYVSYIYLGTYQLLLSFSSAWILSSSLLPFSLYFYLSLLSLYFSLTPSHCIYLPWNFRWYISLPAYDQTKYDRNIVFQEKLQKKQDTHELLIQVWFYVEDLEKWKSILETCLSCRYLPTLQGSSVVV